MQYAVTCECGWHASGARDEVVALVVQHGQQVHGISVTDEQALAQIKPVQA